MIFQLGKFGLYDRASGAVYIHGLIEAITKEKKNNNI